MTEKQNYEEKAVIILDLLKELWELKKHQFVGMQPLTDRSGNVTEELVTNQFPCFFNSEFVDTCVGGNLSPLYHYNDNELISVLRESIEKAKLPAS